MPSTLEQLITDLRSTIDIADLEFFVGRQYRDQQGKPPRVVWVPTGGQITPCQGQTGPRPHKVGDKTLHFYPIYDDVVTLEAHLWAESYEAFERLHQRLLSATRQLFGTASTPGAYVLDTETTRVGDVHAGETKAVQMFAWRTTVGKTRRQHAPGLLSEAGTKLPTEVAVTILGHSTVFAINNDL